MAKHEASNWGFNKTAKELNFIKEDVKVFKFN